MATLATPLFWDLHLHGVKGIDFMHASVDEMVAACEALGAQGIGCFAPTLLTAEERLLREACLGWGVFLERINAKRRFLPKHCATPIGLHLEGPFLNPIMAGAHPKAALQAPSLELANRLLSAARGHVAIVTLAPEMPGAIPLIRKLARAGVRVQLGHTMANATEVETAIRAGARGVTHLYNAMRVHHRSPGALTAVYRGALTAELITDGIHLDADFALGCLRAANTHLYAVSDGCSAVGAKKFGDLTLGALKIERKGGGAYVKHTGVLAGGATYLTEHPARLKKATHPVDSKKLLRHFYEIQQKLFPTHRCGPKRNHFDARDLRFLGMH